MISKNIIESIKTISKKPQHFKVLSQPKLRAQAQKLLTPVLDYLNKYQSKLYSYELSYIYTITHFQSAKNLFLVMDSHLFPKFQNQFTSSINLASLRLINLLAYDQPFLRWLEEVRQIFHLSDLISNDYFLLLRRLPNIFASEDFTLFLKQIFETLQDDMHKFNLYQIIHLREVLSQLSYNSEEKKNLEQMVENSLRLNYNYISQKESPNLARYYRQNRFWLYQYAIKTTYACWISSAFLILLREENYCWKEWALKKYGEKQIIHQLPSGVSMEELQKNKLKINEFVRQYHTNNWFLGDYFEFEEDEEGKKRKLQNGKQTFLPFVENVFNQLFRYKHNIPLQTLKEIQTVLLNSKEEGSKSPLELIKYFSVQTYFNYYFSLNHQQFVEKSISLLQYIDQNMNNRGLDEENKRMSFMIVLRIFSSLPIEVIQTTEAKKLYDLLVIMSDKQYEKSDDKIRKSKKLLMMRNILEEYMAQKQPLDNQIIYGNFSPYNPDHFSNIRISEKAYINNKIALPSALKITLNNEDSFLYIDSHEKISQFEILNSQKVPFTKLWKANYLTNWCKLDYKSFASEQKLIQYLTQINQ